MSCIRLENIINRFVRVDDFFASEGDICAVVGPSGAGKTSMLRIIAGLALHEGRVLFDDEEIQYKRPHERRAGFVSQDLHLFPHLTLEGNLNLAMHSLKIKHSEKQEHILELTELLRITHLRDRKPDTFSGGEKQRAALARVLASSPRVLLLDEPFSKLDFRTARYLRQEFRNLQKRLGLTTIIVTHDIQEARDMADSIWVMQDGALTASIESPASENHHIDNGDTFLEMPNVIACKRIEESDIGIVQVKWAGGILLMPDDGISFNHFTIGRRKIQVDAYPPKGPPINRFVGSVCDVNLNNDDGVVVKININGTPLYIELSPERWESMGLSPGREIHGYMNLRDLNACN